MYFSSHISEGQRRELIPRHGASCDARRDCKCCASFLDRFECETVLCSCHECGAAVGSGKFLLVGFTVTC